MGRALKAVRGIEKSLAGQSISRYTVREIQNLRRIREERYENVERV